MKLIWGSDNVEHPSSRKIEEVLMSTRHTVIQIASYGSTISWVDVGRGVGLAIADGTADRGVVSCWTGTGVAIAANRLPGVRAAVCDNIKVAEQSRLYNHANVLALSLERLDPSEIEGIILAWLKTPNGAEQRNNVDDLEHWVQDRHSNEE